MRPLYVESEHLGTDRIGYIRHEHEAALSIGAYRLPTSTTDLGALKENVVLYKKIAEAAEHAYRDVVARIAFLENQEEQRRLAASRFHAAAVQAHGPATATATAPAAPCMCGEAFAARTVHRTDAPCYLIDNPPCKDCRGNGCQNCAGHGLAVVNPPQLETPAEQTRNLQAVSDDTRAPMPSTVAFNPPVRPPAPTPDH